VTVSARLVPDKSRAFNHRRRNDRPLNRGAGNYQHNECEKDCGQSNPKNDTLDFRPWQTHTTRKLGIGIYKSTPAIKDSAAGQPCNNWTGLSQIPPKMALKFLRRHSSPTTPNRPGSRSFAQRISILGSR
jgi:hypothetical protein